MENITSAFGKDNGDKSLREKKGDLQQEKYQRNMKWGLKTTGP